VGVYFFFEIRLNMSRKKDSRISFDIERCKGCGLCVLFCPQGNLRLSQKLNTQGNPYVELIDAAACNACGICFRMCPDVAIEITGESSDSTVEKTSQQDRPSGKAGSDD